MRPIKPKKMPIELERWLHGVLCEAAKPEDFSYSDARAVLAALKYERQRADAVQPLTKEAFIKAAEKVAYSPEHQRAMTAAVVPKPKAQRAYGNCACGHSHLSHDGEGKACLSLGCGCERWRRG